MTSRGRTLEVRFIGDSEDAIRALRAMNRELGMTEDAEQKATASGRSWSTQLGAVRGNYLAVTAAAAGVVAATAGVTAAIRSAVSAASDQVEAQSRVEAVYGSSAEAILTWADDSARGFGLARTEALGAAGDFGNMFSQLGIGLDVSAQMSTQMVELAADFASFHNADITDVLIAQSAAFRGEYDAVQRYVPIINAAAVEQQALKMGLAESSKELTQQDKALATHALLVQGAGDAAGDFARTSDGLANSQRILGAQLADIRAEIGEALLPVVTDIVGGVSDWIDRNEELLKQDIPNAIQAMADAASNFLGFLNDIRNFGPIDIAVNFVTSAPSGQNLLERVSGVAAWQDLEELGGIWQNRLAGWFGSDSVNARANEIRTNRALDVQGRFGGMSDLETGQTAWNPPETARERADRLFATVPLDAADANAAFLAQAAIDARANQARSGSRRTGGGGGGGRGGGLSALEQEAEATTGKLREMADALADRTGMSLVDAIEQTRDSMAVDDERRRIATQARIDEAVSLAKLEQEAQLALIETTKQLTEGFGNLVARMAGSAFWQRAGQRDPRGAAQQLTSLAGEIARQNASIGLDPNGNPLPGWTNPGTFDAKPPTVINQSITITGEPSPSKVAHDTQMLGLELAAQLDMNGAR